MMIWFYTSKRNEITGVIELILVRKYDPSIAAFGECRVRVCGLTAVERE